MVKRSQYVEYEKRYERKTTLGITFDTTCSQEVKRDHSDSERLIKISKTSDEEIVAGYLQKYKFEVNN